MATFVMINGDNYTVDTTTQIKLAKDAMAAAGIESAPVYCGDPEGPDSYANGTVLFAEQCDQSPLEQSEFDSIANKCNNLDELFKFVKENDRPQLSMSNLPTFETHEGRPINVPCVFSYSDTRLMVFVDGQFSLLPRDQGQATPEQPEVDAEVDAIDTRELRKLLACASSLDELYNILATNGHAYADLLDLPTFGGPEPDDTAHIFAYDATRVLVWHGFAEGNGWEIVPR